MAGKLIFFQDFFKCSQIIYSESQKPTDEAKSDTAAAAADDDETDEAERANLVQQST